MNVSTDKLKELGFDLHFDTLYELKFDNADTWEGGELVFDTKDHSLYIHSGLSGDHESYGYRIVIKNDAHLTSILEHLKPNES